MTGVVPQTIARAKDEKLRAMGVELIKIAGGGSDLLRCATDLAQERGGYFVHPHLDPLWTDGYQSIAAEVVRDLPSCRSLVFPVGGGGLLMGLMAYLQYNPAPFRLFGCEPFNYPKYAHFDHARSTTIADGLILETPAPTGATGDRGCGGKDSPGPRGRNSHGTERPVRGAGDRGRAVQRDRRCIRQGPR